MTRIENIVCESVNDVLRYMDCATTTVCRDNVYLGSTRVPLCVSVARQFCYLVFHDMFHASYSAIARRSGHSTRSVIDGVSKARELLFYDDILQDHLWRDKTPPWVLIFVKPLDLRGK